MINKSYNKNMITKNENNQLYEFITLCALLKIKIVVTEKMTKKK